MAIECAEEEEITQKKNEAQQIHREELEADDLFGR